MNTPGYGNKTISPVKFFAGEVIFHLCCMKSNSLMSWLVSLFGNNRKAEKMRLLQLQRILLRQGLEATAEVMDTTLTEDRVGSLLPVRLWLKLKKADGSFIYTHTLTLASLSHLPGKGQILRIRYLPEDMSSVLILA